jgi:hypothetical protein
MSDILQFLKQHGEQFDAEIAKATGNTLANVRHQLSELAVKGEVMLCHSIRFVKGNKVEGTLCRVAGYIPPVSPGRKSKVDLKLS